MNKDTKNHICKLIWKDLVNLSKTTIVTIEYVRMCVDENCHRGREFNKLF
jgi:hypothetical protein